MNEAPLECVQPGHKPFCYGCARVFSTIQIPCNACLPTHGCYMCADMKTYLDARERKPLE